MSILPLLLSSSPPPLSLSLSLSLSPGCAFTRFQTMRLKQVFPSVLSDQLISYGPCQFPTLGFVVERVSTHMNYQNKFSKPTVYVCTCTCVTCALLHSGGMMYACTCTCSINRCRHSFLRHSTRSKWSMTRRKARWNSTGRGTQSQRVWPILCVHFFPVQYIQCICNYMYMYMYCSHALCVCVSLAPRLSTQALIRPLTHLKEWV